MADALGENDLDRPTVYKAMDRAVALMDMRAKLLGLNAPQKIDLEERLVVISKEYKYDIDELKEIAAEVVAARTAGSLR
jgi:oligoendopeptidase F